MTTPKRLTLTYLALTAGLLVLFGMNLLWGSVSLTPQAVLAACWAKGRTRSPWASSCSCGSPGRSW